MSQGLQCGDPAFRELGSHPAPAQHLLEDATVGGVVIHDQGGQALKAGWGNDGTVCLAKTSYTRKMNDLAQSSSRTFPIRFLP